MDQGLGQRAIGQGFGDGEGAKSMGSMMLPEESQNDHIQRIN